MPAFIPYLIYAAGAAALAHFGSGCDKVSEENSPPSGQSPAGETKTQATSNATPARATLERKVENQQEENPESSFIPYSLPMKGFEHDDHWSTNLLARMPPGYKFAEPSEPSPSEPIYDAITGPPVTCALEIYFDSLSPWYIRTPFSGPDGLLAFRTSTYYGDPGSRWSWGCHNSVINTYIMHWK